MSDWDELYDEREFDESEYYQEFQNGTAHNEVDDYEEDDEDEEREDDDAGSDSVAPKEIDSIKLNDFCNKIGSMDKKLRVKVVELVQDSDIRPLEGAVLGAYLAVYKKYFVEQAQSKFQQLTQQDIEAAVNYFDSTQRMPECKYCGWTTKIGLDPNDKHIVICEDDYCRKEQTLDGNEGIARAGVDDPKPSIQDIKTCLDKFSDKIRGMARFYQDKMKDMIEDRLTYSYKLPVLPLYAHMAGAYIIMMVKSYRERICLKKMLPQLSERQVQGAIDAFDPEAM